jgi:hypothetical protein
VAPEAVPSSQAPFGRRLTGSQASGGALAVAAAAARRDAGPKDSPRQILRSLLRELAFGQPRGLPDLDHVAELVRALAERFARAAQ